MTAHDPRLAARGEGARRLAAPFRVVVLLEERLTLRLRELHAALVEDFPDMAWPCDAKHADAPFDTQDAPTCVVDCGPGVGAATIRAYGRPKLDWPALLQRNRLPEGGSLARRLASAGTCIEIAVVSRGPALSDRLEATRRATALAAVFADLPISVGAIQLWSDRVLSPAQAREVADSAAEGEVPLLDWTLPLLFHHAAEDAQAGLVSGTTVGLSALLGFEIETRQNPEPTGLAIASLLAVAQRVVEGGHTLRDGARVHPFDAECAPHRMRLVPEGRLGNDTDRWCLLHPDSPLDDHRLLGRAEGERGASVFAHRLAASVRQHGSGALRALARRAGRTRRA